MRYSQTCCGMRWGAQEALGFAKSGRGVCATISTLASCSDYHEPSVMHAIHGRQGTKQTICCEKEEDACRVVTAEVCRVS